MHGLLRHVLGAEDAGLRFFNEVFRNLNEGEVGVAPNRDGSAYYVIKVKEKNPSTPEETKAMEQEFITSWGQMRNSFMGDGMTYNYLGQELLSQYSSDWSLEVLEKHDVKFFERQEEQSPDEADES